MTMATTTIRLDLATLPEPFDCSRPNVVAEVIGEALHQEGIRAVCSELFSHLRIDLPTAHPTPPDAGVRPSLHLGRRPVNDRRAAGRCRWTPCGTVRSAIRTH